MTYDEMMEIIYSELNKKEGKNYEKKESNVQSQDLQRESE